jgi:regulator of sigma E protease
MLSLFVVWCAILSEVLAFFGARFAFAVLVGIEGRVARLGFSPDAWESKPFASRVAFSSTGPFASYLIAALCFALSFRIGGDPRPDTASLRVTPAPDSPAQLGGLEDGDRLVSIDGEGVADWDSIRTVVRAHSGGAIPITVERGGVRHELRPIVGDDGRVGISPFIERRPMSAAAAIARGLVSPFGVLREAARGIFAPTAPVELAGPVGIVRAVARTSREQSPVAPALAMAGALLSYFIWIPMLVAGILFPRRRAT